MSAMSWVKGVVVVVGLSLGGSALAAGPAPVTIEYQNASLYERHRDRDFDRDNWDDGWLDQQNDRFTRNDRRLFRLGQKKIDQGRALQARGESLLQRARWAHAPRLARQAHSLIRRGERLEREGRMLVRRAIAR